MPPPPQIKLSGEEIQAAAYVLRFLRDRHEQTPPYEWQPYISILKYSAPQEEIDRQSPLPTNEGIEGHMARIRHLVDDFCSTNGITVRQLDTDIMAYVRDDLDLLGQLVRRLGFDPSSTRIPIFGTPLASQSSDLSNRSKSSRKTYAGATDSSRRRSAIPPVPPKTPPPLEQWNNNKIIIIDERDAQDHDYFGDYLPKIVSRLRDLLLLPENTTKYLVALRGDASLHPPNSKEVERLLSIFRDKWPVVRVSRLSLKYQLLAAWHVRKDKRANNSIHIFEGIINDLERNSGEDKATNAFLCFSLLIHELGHYVATVIHGKDYDTPERLGRGGGTGKASIVGEMGEAMETIFFGSTIHITWGVFTHARFFDSPHSINCSRVMGRFWDTESGEWTPIKDDELHDIEEDEFLPLGKATSAPAAYCVVGFCDASCRHLSTSVPAFGLRRDVF